MKNWLKYYFKKGNPSSSAEWRTKDSIFAFLGESLDTDGKLKELASDLPDENREDENKLRYAPGLMDAMFGAAKSDDSSKIIDELTNIITKIAKYGDKNAESDFYQLVISNESVIGILDEFLERIVKKGLPAQPHLINFSKDMALRTNNRNSVKFGIAIAGLCQDKSVINELKVLGLHDEFTVYAVVALSNLSNNLVDDLFDLARKVDGWGKIQLVDRWAKMDLSDEQRDWLLCKGYQNFIMYQYLAFTCAVNGRLHEKLEENNITSEYFKSAGEILDALIEENGPSEDISDYIYASSVVENYLRHAKTHAADIADLVTLHRIKDFLIGLQGASEKPQGNGWTEDIISNCIIDVIAILDGRDWKELTYEALKSSDHKTYWNGKTAAEKLGIDLWEVVWERLQLNPMDATAWYDVTHYATPEKAEEVIDFALRNIPLNELSTGPKDILGLGVEYVKYQPLDYVITFLEGYPRKGEPIISAGLNSSVTRNRNMAIKVLTKWKAENWSVELKQQLERLLGIEPNKDTKLSIQNLLKGE